MVAMIRRLPPFTAPAALALLFAMTSAMGAPSAQVAGPSEGSTLRPEDLRVAAMGYRLALDGRPLCPVLAPVSGLLLHHLAEYEAADRSALIAAGLDRGPGVLAVVAGSPAAKAGLRAGDVLLTVNGAPFPSETGIAAIKDSEAFRPRLESIDLQLIDALGRGPATLSVLRGGETLSLTVTAASGCPPRIRLARSAQKDAFILRGQVIVTTATLALAANDDELAFVIAHEMAHIILGHTRMLNEAGVPRRGATRGMGRNGKLVRQTEREADQLGGRIMIAAGYDPGHGALILPRLGSGPRLGLFETHDSDGDRIKAMQALGTPAQR